ncbi:MAG: polyphosphate kinase 2 [Gammaproteobacteria bacterium]|nr:polyphosphate kinase 2 [Gammaproteobacteria bacterium]NNC68398.1 polyphosphate kinase 2 [Gammaproteobacteria bacterium]
MNTAEDVLTREELLELKSSRDFFGLLQKKDFRLKKFKQALEYEEDLRLLQGELVKLQRWAQEEQRRVAIIFEGRDAAGKGGTIRRFVEHMNPRAMRIVALPKPSEAEVGQWYFQRYAKQLPNEGEIVFFDRSWYNRAVVEPVNKFCTEKQYKQFMRQVPEFEHMLYEDGIDLIKFWFSISKKEQLNRFASRRTNPLKVWKLSPIDERAQELWDDYTKYKQMMFSKTHTTFSPWIIVQANDKKRARLESIRHVLSNFDYDGKDSAITLLPDPNIITRYHRSATSID